MATCNKLDCNSGYQDLESLLLSLFAKDEDGCIGLKITWLFGVDCEDLTSLQACGTVLTVEQAIKSAIVDDGCDGNSIGVYFLNPDGPE
jgi:hypothetical protein